MSDNLLRRRAAFWSNAEYVLDHTLDDVKARSADKWYNEDDAKQAETLKKLLGEALNVVRRRYSDVLNSQVSEWEEENAERESKTVK